MQKPCFLINSYQPHQASQAYQVIQLDQPSNLVSKTIQIDHQTWIERLSAWFDCAAQSFHLVCSYSAISLTKLSSRFIPSSLVVRIGQMIQFQL